VLLPLCRAPTNKTTGLSANAAKMADSK
jgi:hypothetical protein